MIYSITIICVIQVDFAYFMLFSIKWSKTIDEISDIWYNYSWLQVYPYLAEKCTVLCAM